MIQRIQSLWLLLAAIVAALLFYFGYYKTPAASLTLLNSNYIGAILDGLSVLLSVYTIFMFKKRNLQLNLIWLNILANIGLLVCIFLKINDTHSLTGTANTNGTFAIGAFIPIVTLILLFVARAGIRKDEKLIKSLNRLR